MDSLKALHCLNAREIRTALLENSELVPLFRSIMDRSPTECTPFFDIPGLEHHKLEDLESVTEEGCILLVEITVICSFEPKRYTEAPHAIFVISLTRATTDSYSPEVPRKLSEILKALLPQFHVLARGLVEWTDFTTEGIEAHAHHLAIESSDCLTFNLSQEKIKVFEFKEVKTLTVSGTTNTFIREFDFTQWPTKSLNFVSSTPYTLDNKTIVAEELRLPSLGELKNTTLISKLLSCSFDLYQNDDSTLTISNLNAPELNGFPVHRTPIYTKAEESQHSQDIYTCMPHWRTLGG